MSSRSPHLCQLRTARYQLVTLGTWKFPRTLLRVSLRFIAKYMEISSLNVSLIQRHGYRRYFLIASCCIFTLNEVISFLFRLSLSFFPQSL